MHVSIWKIAQKEVGKKTKAALFVGDVFPTSGDVYK